jgi:menaquinone-dependent protoporphyrinogen IX oxidase
MKVLIAFHTVTGTTREAATIIADELTHKGHTVECSPISDAIEPSSFDAVILGAPIHGMALAPEILCFADQHQGVLRSVKTACFCLSYIYFTGGKFWRNAVEKAFNPIRKFCEPALTGILPGRVERAMPGFARFIFGISKDARTDLFDVEAVRSWARDLTDALAFAE